MVSIHPVAPQITPKNRSVIGPGTSSGTYRHSKDTIKPVVRAPSSIEEIVSEAMTPSKNSRKASRIFTPPKKSFPNEIQTPNDDGVAQIDDNDIEGNVGANKDDYKSGPANSMNSPVPGKILEINTLALDKGFAPNADSKTDPRDLPVIRKAQAPETNTPVKIKRGSRGSLFQRKIRINTAQYTLESSPSKTNSARSGSTQDRSKSRQKTTKGNDKKDSTHISAEAIYDQQSKFNRLESGVTGFSDKTNCGKEEKYGIQPNVSTTSYQ